MSLIKPLLQIIHALNLNAIRETLLFKLFICRVRLLSLVYLFPLIYLIIIINILFLISFTTVNSSVWQLIKIKNNLLMVRL